MATSAARTPPARRASTSNHAATSIARGATARSAVSPKVAASLNGTTRRTSSSRPSSLASTAEADAAANEGLAAALKKETEEKEELLVRVQNKDQNISELASENAQLSAALNAAETRLSELYADQARIEEETATRLELVDRLRLQVQELEREKRDVLRRYNEQATTFDAERQSFYDNEQHLKSRIQSLVQARKSEELHHKASTQSFGEPSIPEEDNTFGEVEQVEATRNAATSSGFQRTEPDEACEPAEMTSLRLELSTLSTSYTSLQTTVQHLSSQLLDLKRVNAQLQEENESYNILLRERTLNGQFDILKSASTKQIDEGSMEGVEGDDEEYTGDDQSAFPSRSRTPLDPVDELAEDMDSAVYGEEHDQDTFVPDDTGSYSSAGNRERSRRAGRGNRRAVASSSSPPPKGESLAGLPVAGPGLDLAAELGRAENSAMFNGTVDQFESRDRSSSNAKAKKGKRQSMDRKAPDAKVEPAKDLDTLRNEVKSLKDANKALSLYASKIIDRIIAQEGFEHVLAADYEKSPTSPTKKQSSQNPAAEEVPKKKARPQSAIFGLSFPSTEPVQSQPSQNGVAPTSPTIPVEQTATTRTQRRSLSFDWRPSFSMFGGSSDKKPEVNSNLRPLTLRPGGSSVITARKLDTQEDDEDRKERERLHATMKLMGINKPVSPTPTSPNVNSPKTFLSTPSSTPASTPNPQSEATSPKPAQPSRFSFFRSRSNTSENSVNSTNSAPARSGSNLTAEALERAEAETTLQALDEREKALSAEIAKGSNGGFTELPSRRQRGEGRSKKSRLSGGSGSGSTVWSAGMSTHKEESGDEAGRA
ncbi:uncharacterized protein FOMMEDRAFT_19222 [Fomitiporia mediterranea MF3/22]|uniref:uncharacterized protein n=1 Tax=Fomitiporia mediterranea (strain MF3/22) TaxID=694068 RepID=UPI0004408C3D|nr:uncharacterized protein FOMMEDRAFT_19222 [Fomitiporia mediterranea MF3/22]EJD03891.1 hypothetical protein FOMMEDRAFT_19222 [Fomitiporia mediterranea MF3/22]